MQTPVENLEAGCWIVIRFCHTSTNSVDGSSSNQQERAWTSILIDKSSLDSASLDLPLLNSPVDFGIGLNEKRSVSLSGKAFGARLEVDLLMSKKFRSIQI